MPFAELLAALMRGAEGSDEATTEGIEAFGKLLSGEEEIRFYVDGTPNFGHQATTVHLLKRVIDVFKFSGAITVVYQDGPPNRESTASKLAKLLTGLVPATIDDDRLEYGTCTRIFFLNYAERAKLAGFPVTLGLTGGADDESVNYAKELNAAVFLRLQPYVWRKPNGAFVPNRIEFRPVDDVARPPVDLSEIADRAFARLAYKFVSAPVAGGVWKWYQTQDFDPTLALNTAKAFAAMKAATERNARIWPVYGLHQFGSDTSKGRDVLLNLLIVGLSHLRSSGASPRPVVMVLLNPAATEGEPADSRTLDTSFVRSFIAANIDAIVKELADEWAFSVAKSRQGPALEQISKALQGYFESLRPDRFAALLPDSPDAIGKGIVAAPDSSVFIAPVGPVPQEVYNAFFATAEMPGVFEGQGTSSLTISLGKPYLQIPKPNVGGDNYPNTLLLGYDYEAEPQFANLASELVRLGFSDYARSGTLYVNTIDNVTVFVNECYRDGSMLSKYFARLLGFFSKDVHDKLLLGLVAVTEVLTAPLNLELAARKAIAPEVPLTLDAVFAALTAAWSGGAVNLFAALPGSQLASYYGAITGATFIVNVAQSDIVKETGAGGSLVAVVVRNGTTTAFGTPFDLELRFTAPFASVVSDLSCRAPDPWILGGVPWIGFEEPGFDMTVSETPAPVRGAAVGKIKGTPLTLGIQYPVQPNQWAVTGTFDAPYPSIATFYSMAGGVNLAQSLPAPLNTLSGFGLREIEIAYDTATPAIAGMMFAFETSEPWTILSSPKLAIQPRVAATIANPASATRTVSYVISGEVTIGTGSMTISAVYPNFQVGGALGSEIALADLMAMFGVNAPVSGAISELSFFYAPALGDYSFATRVDAQWPIVIAGKTIFEITSLGFNVMGTAGANFTVGFSGSTVILPDNPNASITIDVYAEYRSATKSWLFSGKQVAGEISLSGLIAGYLGWSVATDYAIAGLAVSIDTAESSYAFSGRTAAPWVIPFLDASVSASLSAGSKSGAGFGRLDARIVWQNIDLAVFFDYSPAKNTFGMTWGPLEGAVTHDLTTDDWVATLSFTDNVTVGSLIETMVSWATGSAFGLEAPWNLLSDISLSGVALTFTFNKSKPANNRVGLEVSVGPIDVGFARIDGIAVTYQSQAAQKVAVTLTGSFPWNTANTSTLGPWDAAQPGTAPAPAGNGSKYFDLRLLALGQHVTVTGITDAKTVQAAIAILATLPDPEPGVVPDVTFDSESSWLIGADFGVLKIGDGKSME